MELTNEFNLKEIEQSTKDYLSKLDLQKMIDDSSDKRDKIMFIEGPPTLNGEPHAGHLRGRVFKDLWYRFNTLNSKNIVFNAGWDTQGLPVELQAEKELGIAKGRKADRTEQEIKDLVVGCKKTINKYWKKWVQVDKELGVSLNQDNAYENLDSAPSLLTAKDHRPAYGSDGDYFSKPSINDIFEKTYSILHESDPKKYPKLR